MLLQLTSVLIIIDVSTTQLQFPRDTTSNNYGRTPISQYTVDSSISKELFKLSNSLATQIQNERTKDVYVFSPVNIAATLSLVLLGSRGRTFDELANVLGLNSNANFLNHSLLFHEKMGILLQTIQDNSGSNLGYKVNLASAIFVQDGYPIRTIYKDISQTFYRGDAYNVNFENGEEAENTVNEWVRINTNSKISKILEKTPDSKTKVIIVGVLYFNAEWETPFWEGGTDKRPFYMNGINSKSNTMIDMMTTGGVFPYYHDTYFNCEILGLPYKGNKTTMFIIKPKNSSKEKLKQLQSKLTPYDLERLINSTTDATCAVGFPKMRLESFHNLAKPLRQLGVKSLFIRTNANLALLSPGLIRPGAPNRMGLDSNLTKYDDSVIVFPRFSSHENCTEIFDPITNITKCEYSSIPHKVKRQTARLNSGEALDYLRASLPDSDNPGIFASDVFHKVYIDINEKGTEAAAATSVSFGKGGDIVTFRADTPFLFYIFNHDAQVVLFWGAVNTPTPSYN